MEVAWLEPVDQSLYALLLENARGGRHLPPRLVRLDHNVSFEAANDLLAFSRVTADNIFRPVSHFRPVLVLSAFLDEPGDASLRHRIEPLSRLDGIDLLHGV
jgi:hypothetical protein